MNTIALVLLGFLATSCAQHTTPSPEVEQFLQNVHTMVEDLYRRADRNSNGHFDSEDLGDIVTDYDSNGDGAISRTEFLTHFATNASDIFMLTVATGLFLDLDVSKNNVIEHSDIQLYFQKLDTNRNGRVEHQEFVNYFTQLFEIILAVAIKNQHDALSSTATP